VWPILHLLDAQFIKDKPRQLTAALVLPKHRGGEQIPVSELHFIEASVIIDAIFG